MSLTQNETPARPHGPRAALRIVLRWLAAYLAALAIGTPLMVTTVSIVTGAPSVNTDLGVGLFILAAFAATVMVSLAPALIVTVLTLRGRDRSRRRAALDGAVICVASAMILPAMKPEPFFDSLFTLRIARDLLLFIPAGAVAGLVFRWVWMKTG